LTSRQRHRFEDTGGGTDATLSSVRRGAILTNGRHAPFLNSRSTTGGGAASTSISVGRRQRPGFSQTGWGTVNLARNLTGSGSITLSAAPWRSAEKGASAFTGESSSTGGPSNFRGGNANAFGSTDKGITLNGGRLRLRDLGPGFVVPEPVIVKVVCIGAINNA
jgi:hypothetical protein